MISAFPRRLIALLAIFVLSFPNFLIAQTSEAERVELVREKLRPGNHLRLRLHSKGNIEANFVSLDANSALRLSVFNKEMDRFHGETIPLDEIQALTRIDRKKSAAYPLRGGLLATFTFIALTGGSLTSLNRVNGVFSSADHDDGSYYRTLYVLAGLGSLVFGALIGLIVAPVSETQTGLWSD